MTSAVVETLAAVDLNSPAANDGAAWLAGETAANHEFLARQVTALGAIPGFEARASGLAAQLLAARNPAEPDPAFPRSSPPTRSRPASSSGSQARPSGCA